MNRRSRVGRMRRPPNTIHVDTAAEATSKLNFILCLICLAMVLCLFAPNTLMMEALLAAIAAPTILALLLLKHTGQQQNHNNQNNGDELEGIALVRTPKKKRDKREIQEVLLSQEVPDECVGEECDICQDLYLPEQMIAESPNPDCHHVFHLECISEWLVSNDDCPICRRNYLHSGGDGDDTENPEDGYPENEKVEDDNDDDDYEEEEEEEEEEEDYVDEDDNEEDLERAVVAAIEETTY